MAFRLQQRRSGLVRAAIIGGLLAGLVFSAPARAYLDPGTGSYLLQILLAAVLGVGVAARIYWQKIKSLLFPSRSKRAAEKDSDG